MSFRRLIISEGMKSRRMALLSFCENMDLGISSNVGFCVGILYGFLLFIVIYFLNGDFLLGRYISLLVGRCYYWRYLRNQCYLLYAFVYLSQGRRMDCLRGNYDVCILFVSLGRLRC